MSAASYWELAIKVSLGKYQLTVALSEFIAEAVRLYALTTLHIAPRHVEAVVDLPYHHRDPFDRLLVAQAIVENVCIVSVDQALDAYPIRRIW